METVKKLIENNMNSNQIADKINGVNQNEIISERGWYSYASQPNIKIIEVLTLYQKKATTTKIIDENTFSALGNIAGNTNHSFKEIITVTPKTGEFLGMLMSGSMTIIHLPRKSKYTIYSWDEADNLIRFESSSQDRLVAIGKNIAFSILSKKSSNPALLFFFNVKPHPNLLKIDIEVDSNNPESSYFIKENINKEKTTNNQQLGIFG